MSQRRSCPRRIANSFVIQNCGRLLSSGNAILNLGFGHIAQKLSMSSDKGTCKALLLVSVITAPAFYHHIMLKGNNQDSESRWSMQPDIKTSHAVFCQYVALSLKSEIINLQVSNAPVARGDALAFRLSLRCLRV